MPPCASRRLHAPAVALCGCVLSLVCSAGCGGPNRPDVLGDIVGQRPPGGDSGPPPIDLSRGPAAPMCNIGPEGGVCACTDEPLLGDAPNLYFMLDRSGSMNELNKWGTVQTVLQRLYIALGPRAKVGAAVFPDPAGADTCAPGVEVFAPQRGDAPAGTAGPTEAVLITTLGHIDAAGGTPTAVTLTSMLPYLKSLPGKTFVVLATDGGPNCNADAMCGADQCTYNIESLTGCTPTGPNCCSDPRACLDAAPTSAAVRAYASAGIPVYVVGVPGSAPYASLLDELARVGGTARAGEPAYYAVNTADEDALLAALSSIAAKITGSCTLQLSDVPASPGLVNVFLDERVLPQSGPDGWTLDGAQVSITGASCQKILSGEVLDVRIVAGCPTVTI